MPDFPTSIGLCEGGGFIVGLCREVCFWRPDGALETFVVPEPDLPDNRLNEGSVLAIETKIKGRPEPKFGRQQAAIVES